MKTKRIDLYIVLCVMLMLYTVSLLASAGCLSTDERPSEQNVLGGTGSISLVNGDGRQMDAQMFRDEENLYFMWFPDGKRVLYAYSLLTGQAESVCKRIGCPHNIPACVLYDLSRYDATPNPSVHQRYCVADDCLYYAVNRGEILQLWQWNPQSEIRRHITDYPAYLELRDERGLVTKQDGELDKVMRLGNERIAVCCTNVIYIYDNDFHEITQIPIGSPNMPFCVVGEQLMWQDYYGCVYCYDTQTDEIRMNVLPDMPYALNESCCYQGVLYYAMNEKIYVYTPKTDITRMLTATTPMLYEAALYGCGSHLYYRNGEGIVRRDLESGTETQLPDLPAMPEIETDDYLIVRNLAAETPTEYFTRYDLNGKAVME